MALIWFQLFPSFVTMLGAVGFVSTKLKVLGNDNKPGAPEGISLEEKRSFQNNLSNGSTAVERTPAILADTYLRIHV